MSERQPSNQATTLDVIVREIRACTLCADDLLAGVRPVIQASRNARILIAGQAPGSKVHASGIPFDDPSGDRLRDWMGVDKNTFYDKDQIALIPMGFCYPGKGTTGDLPPRRICAETWRAPVVAALPNVRLTLVIGRYAQAWHLTRPRKNLTETVRAWREFGTDVVPLPHPSPRNNIWLKRNAWFEGDLLPTLKTTVARALFATQEQPLQTSRSSEPIK